MTKPKETNMSTSEIESICQKSMIYYYDYLSSARDQVPDDVCDHIAECAYCQQELLSLKQIDSQSDTDFTLTSAQTTHLELHFALAYQPIKCSTIKAFLPVLAIPGQQVTIATPVTTHLEHCSRCSEELKTLKELDLSVLQYGLVSQMFSNHSIESPEAFSASQMEVVSEMLNRPDSGVVTCFRLKDPLKDEPGESYEVDVSTEDVPLTKQPESKRAEATAHDTIKVQPRASKQRRFLRPLAAAAVLMIAALLLFQNSPLQATDIGQIYEALKNVTNVSMTQYDVDEPAPIQQTWMSRSLGIKLYKEQERFTLWDIENKTRKIYGNDAAQIQSTMLEQDAIETVAKTMDAPYGLLPFKNVSELPRGAVWEKVQSQEAGPDIEKTEIYNLFWTQKSATGNSVDYQWQCHIDAATKCPLKIMWGKKNPDTQNHELTTRIEITYPTQGQVRDIVEQAGL